MSFLGIDRDSGATYVGETMSSGYRCQSEPFLAPIRFALGPNVAGFEKTEGAFNLPKRIFKEVFFDPITRVRRGEVYAQYPSQPVRWTAQDHYRKDMGNAFIALGSKYLFDLVTYQHDRLEELRSNFGNRSCPRVVLGDDEFTTFWKIISVESSISKVPVLTIKSEQFFGEVPEIVADKVPESVRQNLTVLLDDIASSAHRLSPVAVVDRCRDCLAMVFGGANGAPDKDLTPSMNEWVRSGGNSEDVRVHCGRIVARLHSRGKPNEQAAKGLPPLSESDALLALRCLWTVLIEFGCARG